MQDIQRVRRAAVIWLFEEHQCSFEEIAQALRMSRVYVRLLYEQAKAEREQMR